MKVVVLLSGGQDSTTALYWAKHVLPTAHAEVVEAVARGRGHAVGPYRKVEVHALSVYYGQRHERELGAAQRIAQLADVASHTYVDLHDVFAGSESALLDPTKMIAGDGGLPDAMAPNGLPTSFVPARNLLFLSLAAAHAGVVEADFVVTGVCQTDYSGYPDCRESFVKAMQGAIDAAWPSGTPAPRVLTPLMHMTKAETVKLARELPGCWDALAVSMTCYQGIEGGCLTCPACALREKGFRDAGERDPTRDTWRGEDGTITVTPRGEMAVHDPNDDTIATPVGSMTAFVPSTVVATVDLTAPAPIALTPSEEPAKLEE